MTRAFVTGATGFIGPHLVRELRQQGIEVTCLRRAASDITRLAPLGVAFKAGHVADPEALRAAVFGADVVFHLAGMTRALARRQLHAVNVEGTRNLLTACAAQRNPPVVVIVSSLAAAGPSLGDQPRDEADEPAPVSEYGRSKRTAELVAHEFADRMPITIVRPPLVFGQGDQSVLAMMRPIRRIGVHLVPGFVDRRLSVIHATDLATALIAAARDGKRLVSRQASGFGLQASADGILASDTLKPEARSPKPEARSLGYYHVADDEQPTYAELGCRVSLALGRGALVLRTPQWVAWVGAGMSEIAARLRRRQYAFNWDKAREATAGSWTCSTRRAKAELGWSCAADLDARLAETIAWYRRYGWL